MKPTVVFMAASVLANSSAHVLLKFNSVATAKWARMNFSPLESFHIGPLFIAALGCFACSLVFYSRVLQNMALMYAFPVMNTCVYLVVGVAAWLLFGERLSPAQLAGLAVTVGGLWLFSLK